ncbi:hypothetical protein ACERK3_10235 [Phycisphaerales bacterium AB-hyl4]|uniref:YbbR-like protein n=1 Tax=Natronomicrosphaera hydrolytica TaxID=3242702 RepID=A0ABV4U830_9BACT
MGKRNPANPNPSPTLSVDIPTLGKGEHRADRGVLDKIQTAVLVTIIAVLVWLYAEGEAVQERPKQVRIQFVTPGTTDVGIAPNSPLTIGVTFQASTGQITQVEQLLSRGPIEIPVTPEQTNDNQQVIVLREALERSALGELGVNIKETSPATQTVRVEQLQTVALDVALELAQPEMVAPRPRIDPSRVSVTVPASMVGQMRGMRAIARLDDLSTFEPDEQHTTSLRVTLPDTLDPTWVRVEPGTVDVTFTLREQTDEITLTSVSINVVLSAPLARQYIVEVPEEHNVLRDVVLRGPADQIDLIRRKERPIRAYLRPTADELDRGVEMLNVELDKPGSVSVESPLPSVPVVVSRRD